MIYKKIADNNVEAYEEVTVLDTEGSEKTILRYVESIGQEELDNRKVIANAKLVEAEGLAEYKYKSKLIEEKAQAVAQIKGILALMRTESRLDKDDKTFLVYAKDDTLRFGTSPESLVAAEVELSDARNLDEPAYIAKQVNVAKAEIATMASIQSVMDRK